MPEVSAADLRRLKSLEARLERTEESRKSVSAELRAERAERAAVERALRGTRGEVDRLRAQVDALVAENKALAERAPSVQRENEVLRQAAVAARGAEAKALDAAKSAVAERDAAAKAAAGATAASEGLKRQLATAQAQLRAGKFEPLIEAEEAGRLVDDFVTGLRGGVGGLKALGGEVRLRVAFARAGDVAGLVVPSPDSVEVLADRLSEVVVRFAAEP
ncbi:MAG: hypothetical protein ACKVVT_00710 [Dehalococcoidia bacterium]